jgi:hypothetical protein
MGGHRGLVDCAEVVISCTGSGTVCEKARAMSASHVVRATTASAAHENIATELQTRIWRRARQQLRRLTAQREPQTAEELMAYARNIQHSMPALAAELQCVAQHGLEADA